MTNTDILLEDLEDVLDDATSMPMTKKSLVDVDKIKTIIEDIRLNTPQETKQAKAIVDSRNNILDEAKKEAAKIISEAQAQARELVARDQITQNAQKEATEIIAKAHSEGEAYVKQAQNQASELLGKATTQANEMVTTAQNKSREMLTAVNNYADDTLLEIDEVLHEKAESFRVTVPIFSEHLILADFLLTIVTKNSVAAAFRFLFLVHTPFCNTGMPVHCLDRIGQFFHPFIRFQKHLHLFFAVIIIYRELRRFHIF